MRVLVFPLVFPREVGLVWVKGWTEAMTLCDSGRGSPTYESGKGCWCVSQVSPQMVRVLVSLLLVSLACFSPLFLIRVFLVFGWRKLYVRPLQIVYA